MRFRRPGFHARRHPAASLPYRQARWRHGFTLIEASLAIVIVGVGVLAAAQLLSVGTAANADSHRLTTGLNLAANVREYAQQKTGTQILALNGQTYSPARDARNVAIPGLDDWEQVIVAERVTPTSITVPAGTSSTSRLIRLNVTVRYRGKVITQEQWLLADTTE